MSVRSADLADKLAFGADKPDSAAQWTLFHLIGASLRHEAKAH
jgi:negative regulator of sigma E activity